jgi:hypothetical protein
LQLKISAEDYNNALYPWNRGNDEYDPTRVGFQHERDRSADGRKLFLFETEEPDGTPRRGNGNAGHEYGTELSDDEKQAIVEYLKTL